MTGRSKAPAKQAKRPVLVLGPDHDRLTKIKLARQARLQRLVSYAELVHEALDELERAEA